MHAFAGCVMNKYASKYDFQNAKTEEAIKNAFLDLSAGKKMVTVSAICERVGINRSTFYRHFEDIYDLVDHYREELLSELRSLFFDIIKPDSFNEDGTIKQSVIKRVLYNCHHRKREIIVLVDTNRYGRFQNDFAELIAEATNRVLDNYTWKYPKYKAYISARQAYGATATIVRWLREEDMSLNEFSRFFTETIYNAMELRRSVNKWE